MQNVNIELFEGDNYIYLIDMVGNKFYAEYLIKNEFNDIYVTEKQMNSAINQTSGQIELSVTQKLNEELTGANIILKINEDNESEAQINADKIELTANDILNLLAGNTINLTSKNIVISSTNFNVDKTGKVDCQDINIKSGKIKLDAGSSSNPNFQIGGKEGVFITNDYFSMGEGYIDSNNIEISASTVNIPRIGLHSSGKITEILSTGITTPKLTQTSLKSKKKNIRKLKVNALELVKNADICEYNFKGEKKEAKKHIGLVIGKGYNCPNEVISEDGQGVEQYSLTSLLWKAVQELTEKVERLEANLNEKN